MRAEINGGFVKGEAWRGCVSAQNCGEGLVVGPYISLPWGGMQVNAHVWLMWNLSLRCNFVSSLGKL